MKKKIHDYLRSLTASVWLLLFGHLLTSFATFMCLPFLAIHLKETLHLPPTQIGLVLGIAPLAACISGFVYGHISDRYGRRRCILFCAFLRVAVYVGFAFANHSLIFFLLNLLNGLSQSGTIAKSYISEHTSESHKARAFGLLYVAANVGAALGPIAGLLFIKSGITLAFLITALANLAYGLSLKIILKDKLDFTLAQASNRPKFVAAVHLIAKDTRLMLYLFAFTIVSLGYSQLDSTLPQFLADLNFINLNSIDVYSALMSLNGLTVIFLQIPLDHLTKNQSPVKLMNTGIILISLGLLGFGFSSAHFSLQLISMFVFTLGEMLEFTSSNLIIDRMAVAELRGTYFGAGGLRQAGRFIGPWLGGALLQYAAEWNVFAILSLLVLTAFGFAHKANLWPAQNRLAVKTLP